MVVFSHRSLPLTANVSKLRESDNERKNRGCLGDEEEFFLIVKALIRSVKKGLPLGEDISWNYEFSNLWSPDLLDSEGRKCNMLKVSPARFRAVLATGTYWYPRLPKSGRSKVRKLSFTAKGRRWLRDVLNTVDGVLFSLLFGFPEMFIREGYAFSDRVINSVIMNCFHNYSRFQKNLKTFRKRVKHAALNKIPLEASSVEGLRDMSYFAVPLQILNHLHRSSSKSKMFRVAVMSQTRATGLAGLKQCQDALSEFISNVTVEREFNPNTLMKQCISTVVDHAASIVKAGMNPEFRISMSTSACTECPRRAEGKFGYLKQVVERYGIEIPKLSDGIEGTLGNALWPRSRDYLEHYRESVMKTNVAAVRENGKARIVTSGSFWKEVALQPFSHITIHLIKNFPNLADGLQAGRLGWKFIQKVHTDTPMQAKVYDFIFRDKAIKTYSSDWSNATDLALRGAARSITGSLLEKCGLQPKELDCVMDYWLGPKSMYVNNKFVGHMVDGVPMGDPLTKTNLSLAHPIVDLYARLKTASLAKEEGNGDDVEAFCTREYALAHQEGSAMLGYKTSELDTAVTSDWGTYCEEWFHKPVSRANTVRRALKLNKPMLLPYLDVPKGRILIGTEKDREDFSSDRRGKVTLLGHDEEYVSKYGGPLTAIFSIAGAFQDVCLDTLRDKYPMFMPRQVHGVGRPPTGWSVTSYKNILKHVRGWHRKYYLYTMQSLLDGKGDLAEMRGSLKSNKHFDKELLLELYEIPETEPIKKAIAVRTHEWDLYPNRVLTKLIKLGYLVPESKISAMYLFQRRLSALKQEDDSDLFEVVKAHVVKYPDLSDEEETRILRGFCQRFRDSPYELRAELRENLYPALAYKLLEKGNPLNVTFMDFPLLKKFYKRPVPEDEYNIHGGLLYQWFMGAHAAVKRGQRYEQPPTDILEDDPIIIDTINDGGADIFVIVTDDRKLFRLALNKFPTQYISRMSVVHYLQTKKYCMEHELDYQQEFEAIWKRSYGNVNVKLLIDKGNVDGWMAQYDDSPDKYFRIAIGIPWDKDIKAKNMEHDESCILLPSSRSFQDLGMPRSVTERRDHGELIRNNRVALDPEGSS